MSLDATPSRPRSTRPLVDDDPFTLPRRSPVPKIIGIVLLLAVIGGGGFLGWRAYQGAEARTARVRADLAAAQRKGQDAEKRATDTATTLAGQEAELAALRALQAEVAPTRLAAEQAATVLTKVREAVGEAGTASAEGGRVSLVLGEDSLFEGGKDELTDAGKEVLGKLAKALEPFPTTQLRVEAHTGDRRPRDKQAFPSNWELSTARALAVVHWLEDEAHLDGDRLSVVAFSQFRPRGTDRAARSRIEIAIVPKDLPVAAAATTAPAPTAAAPRHPIRRPAPQKRSDTGLGSL